jgi:membrane-associated phospholipid phosphatase
MRIGSMPSGSPLASWRRVRSFNRRFITPICSAIAFASHAASLAAQTPLGPERSDIRHFTGDIWSIVTSPVHTDQRAVVPLLAVGTSVGIAAEFADSAMYVWMTTHPNAGVIRMLSPIREGRRFPLFELGSGQYLLPLSGALYMAGRLRHSVSLRDAGLGCAAGHLSSALLRDVIYLLVSRARPRVTPSPDDIAVPGSSDWNKHSFLSGHAANSMACASFMSHRFSLGAAEPVMYTYVGAIGLGRMLDGRHWFSDTMAGAMMGFAIGKGIADRQLHRDAALASLVAPGARASIPIIQWSIGF